MPQYTESVVKQDSETGSCGLVKSDFHFQRFRGWDLIGRRNLSNQGRRFRVIKWLANNREQPCCPSCGGGGGIHGGRI